MEWENNHFHEQWPSGREKCWLAADRGGWCQHEVSLELVQIFMACIKTNDFQCWFIKKLEGLLWELKKGSGIYSFLFELFSWICLQLIYSFQSGKAVEEESTHGGNYWHRYSAQGSGDHTAHQNPGVLSPWGPPQSCMLHTETRDISQGSTPVIFLDYVLMEI